MELDLRVERRNASRLLAFLAAVVRWAGADGTALAAGVGKGARFVLGTVPAGDLPLADFFVAHFGVQTRRGAWGWTLSELERACTRAPALCGEWTTELGCSVRFLESVEGEYAVDVEEGAVRPRMSRVKGGGRETRRSWWRPGEGNEVAWVPWDDLP